MSLQKFLEHWENQLSAFLKTRTRRFWITTVISFFLLVFYVGLVAPPSNFPVSGVVLIEDGATLSEISAVLDEQGIIKSPLFFEGVVIGFNGEGGVLHGQYFFEDFLNVFQVARRLTKGEFGLEPFSITIPEGASVAEIALIFEKQFPEFDAKEFLVLALDDEGYLFPDTYRFLPNVEAPQVYRGMRNVFNERIEEIKEQVERSGKELHDIITMASILEEEARTPKTRRKISGILWKRLEVGMLLQVDAVFPYIIGKNTFQLTLEDLKIDSPYNTYKYPGLPPGPITNPGMDSILAALEPEESPYFFYLSDLEGNMHYARNFEEHKINKARYLP